MRSISYKPHIDGLRGLAVILVLLFHFDVFTFKGGFIGVDVFFAISGYLISSIILKKIEAQTFFFKEFYLRRIKRLLPTMLFTVTLTLIFAYFFFPIYMFEKLINSAIAALLSFSNILFFNQAGYFDTAASLKPLLHTWSLSVEEQFYLLWPLLLFLLSKLKQDKHKIIVLILLGGISLYFSHFFVNKNASISFFLTPFRIFEFIIGALIVWVEEFKFKNYIKEILGGLSLLGLLYFSINYSQQTLFPGLNAVLPCLFSAILIHDTGNSKYVGFLISNKLFVWIGKISYSLYLVHWPLLVFYKSLYKEKIETLDIVILFVSSILCAFLIFKFIETPFRKITNKQGEKKLYAGILIMIFSILTIGILNNFFDLNLINRDKSNEFTIKQIDEGKNDRFRFSREIDQNKITFEDVKLKNKVLIWGDSHAPDALNFLKLSYPEYQYYLQTEGGCPPIIKSEYSLIDGHPIDMKNKCYELNDKVFSKDYLSNFDFIVINVMFEWYKPRSLKNAINEIKKRSNAKIIVFGNYIVLNQDLPKILADKKEITDSLVKSIALYDDTLKKNSKGLYRFISKKELLCDGDSIKDCIIKVNDKPFTYDDNHLSFELAELIAERIKEREILIFK